MDTMDWEKSTDHTNGGHFRQLSKELQKKINNGALQYMNEKNIAETFLGEMKDKSMEILPLLKESKPQPTDSSGNSKGRNSKAVPRTLNEILQGFERGHMSVVGPAGSGKSTLLKTIARNVIEKKYKALSYVDVAIYIKCGDLDTSRFATPTKLLLSMIQPQLRDDELKEFKEFAEAYPEKVLFLFDGLDTFPGYFYKETSHAKVRKGDEKKRVKDIICEMMEGEIFKDCRMITSSRDSTQLGQSIKSTVKVVNLSGLTESSIEKISYQYFSYEEGEAFLSYLEDHPRLLDLCQTPMFLIFTLIGKKGGPGIFPTTMSEILLFLLDCLLRSKHSTLEVSDLKNLGDLCFWLMKEQKVNFGKSDLNRYHLTVEKVQNLVVDTPGAQSRRMFFIHRSIVEMLASFHILNMKTQGISGFAKKYLLEFHPEFAPVEQMLCGMLLNETVRAKCSFLQDDSLDEKRDALKSHLRDRIRDLNALPGSPDSCQTIHVLNLILSLHEAGESVDTIIKSVLRSIVLDGSGFFFPLPASDVRAIGTVVSRCDQLDVLALNFWYIQDEHVNILHACISKTCPKISRMELQGNFLTSDGMMHAGRLIRCCHIKDFSLACSETFSTAAQPQEALKSLKSSLQDHKLNKLDISFSTLEIKECQMTPEIGTWNVKVSYVVDPKKDLSLPQQLMAWIQPEVVWEISVPGLWREASTDFARAIGSLMMNVAERIDVYNWKFEESDKDLLRRKLSETDSTVLEINISEDKVISDSNIGDLRCASDPCERTPTTQKVAQVTEIREITEIPELQVAGQSPLNVVDFFSTHDHAALEWIQKFQLSHQQVTEDQISKLSMALTKVKFLKELELRNCRPEHQLMSKLQQVLEGSKTKISKLSVTALESVSQFFPEMSKILDLCETRNLNIEETGNLGNFLQLFLKYLQERQIDNFHELNLSHVKEIEDFKTLGRIISGNIYDLKLANCDLETEKLQTLCSTVSSSKIQYLDLSYNPDLVEEDIALLPRLLCKEEVRVLALRDCGFSSVEMEAFDDPAFEGRKVHELDLSYNGELKSDGLELAGKVARKLCTKKLSLGSCELDEECLKSLMFSLQDHNVSSLDLRENAKISSRSKTVAEFVVQCKTRVLNISDCKLGSDQISSFADALLESHYKLGELNLSDSLLAVIDDTFAEAILKVLNVVEDKLIICFPRLEQKGREMIQASLSKSENGKTKVIYRESRQMKDLEFLTLVGKREEKQCTVMQTTA